MIYASQAQEQNDQHPKKDALTNAVFEGCYSQIYH